MISKISPNHVGLRPRNTAVRRSLPTEISSYLATLDEWFQYLEDWRHSLAHRVPFYIPQFCVDPTNEGRYQDLEKLKSTALGEGDTAAFDRLHSEQERLGWFNPIIQGSFAEGFPMIQFHNQILVDFVTVEAIALRMVTALDHHLEPSSGHLKPPAGRRT